MPTYGDGIAILGMCRTILLDRPFSQMIGEHAFCPTNGAELSREDHYDERGRPERVPQSDDLSPDAALEAPLTTGKRRSSKRALATYFQRCHQRHTEPDDDLYRRALLIITRLKRTAMGREARDVIIWYALSERLAREGVDIDWMASHVEPRCPECGGRLKYVSGPNGPIGRCGTSCIDAPTDQLYVIRTTVCSLLDRTFATDTPSDTDALTLL